MKYLQITILLLAFCTLGYCQEANRKFIEKINEKSLSVPKLNFDNNGELIIHASPSSTQNDFDYLIGNWRLINHKLKKRLEGCTEWAEFEATVENKTLLNGIGNLDIYRATFDSKPYEGVALRLFNPKTKLWSIYWTDSNTGAMDPPMVGSFKDNIGTFFCRDVFKDKPIIVVFHWDKTDKDKPVWSQAFSVDKGLTWEWNFTNVSVRDK